MLLEGKAGFIYFHNFVKVSKNRILRLVTSVVTEYVEFRSHLSGLMTETRSAVKSHRGSRLGQSFVITQQD